MTGPITVTSAAFVDGGTIPRRHTCDGEDLSPSLSWSGIPSDAVELALLCEDPDAPGGTFVHWVLYGVPPDVKECAEGTVPSGAQQGLNDFGRRGWGGPCPPRGGGAHRYIFTLLVLSRRLNLPDGATAARVRGTAEGAVLAEGRLTGTYGR